MYKSRVNPSPNFGKISKITREVMEGGRSSITMPWGGGSGLYILRRNEPANRPSPQLPMKIDREVSLYKRFNYV